MMSTSLSIVLGTPATATFMFLPTPSFGFGVIRRAGHASMPQTCGGGGEKPNKGDNQTDKDRGRQSDHRDKTSR